MEELFVSPVISFSKEGETFQRNGEPLVDESGVGLSENAVKGLIKGVVSDYIHKSFNNVIVLVGAGSSVVCEADGKIDARYGKTVGMLAEIIYRALKDNPDAFSLSEMAELCKYDVSVEKKR